LAFKPEGKGAQRLLVSREQVWKEGQLLLNRPDAKDDADVVLRTQTHLEQIQTNISFREVVEFLSEITYLAPSAAVASVWRKDWRTSPHG
jgi:hypothetical protein